MQAPERPIARRGARTVTALGVAALTLVWLAAVTARSGAVRSVIGQGSVVAGTPDLGIERDADQAAMPALPAVGTAPWVPPQPGAWSMLPVAPVGPRVGHVVAEVGGRALVWGGYQNERPLGGGAVFDATTGSWEQIRDAPQAERGHVAVSAGEKLLLLDERYPLAYDLATDRWQALPRPPLPDGVLLSRVTAWTGQVAVVLTRTLDGRQVAPLAYDVLAEAWFALPPPPVAVTGGQALVWDGRDLLLFARTDEGAGTFVHRLKFPVAGPAAIDEVAWVGVSPPPLTDAEVRTASVRAVATGEGIGDPVFLWIGQFTGPLRAPQMLRFTASNAEGQPDQWERLASPPLRESLTELAWTGEELLAVGDSNAGAYEPSTGVFRRLPPPGIAGGQQRDAAWTGTHLIWWGGATADGAAWRPPSG